MPEGSTASDMANKLGFRMEEVEKLVMMAFRGSAPRR